MTDIATAADRARGRTTFRPKACACRMPSAYSVSPRCPPRRRSGTPTRTESALRAEEGAAVRRIDPTLAELLLLLALAGWLRLASGFG